MSKKKLDQHLVDVVKGLKEKRIDPSALSPRLRRKIVAMFMEEDSTVTSRNLAELLGVSESQVRRLRRTMVEKSAYDFERDLQSILYSMRMKRDEYQRRALLRGDVSTAWRIEVEFIEKLQDMGVVFKAPKHIIMSGVKEGEEADSRSALRKLFADSGVPTMPEFVARLKMLTGGNGGGNGDGGGKVIDATVVERGAGVRDGRQKGGDQPAPPDEWNYD